jgi:ABC-type phosphate/phosphonate transport system ATPase subunit
VNIYLVLETEGLAKELRHCRAILDLWTPIGLSLAATAIIGSTGAGKTQLLQHLFVLIRQKGDKEVMYGPASDVHLSF